MAGKTTLFDDVMNKLTLETKMHFGYQVLFQGGINPEDKEAVTEKITKDYLNGKTLEEFAIDHIVNSITEQMKKYAPKPKKTETESKQK